MNCVDRIRNVARDIDGALLATVFALFVVAMVNLVVAYRAHSLADAVAAVIIFLVIGVWLAVRRSRRIANPRHHPSDH